MTSMFQTLSNMQHPENLHPCRAKPPKFGIAFKMWDGRLVDVELEGNFIMWKVNGHFCQMAFKNALYETPIEHEIKNAYLVMLYGFAHITIGENDV